MSTERFVTPVLRPIALDAAELLNTTSDYLVVIRDELYVGKFSHSEYEGWLFLGHDEWPDSEQRGTFLRTDGNIHAIWQVIR